MTAMEVLDAIDRRLDTEQARTRVDEVHSRETDPHGDPYLHGVLAGLAIARGIVSNFAAAATISSLNSEIEAAFKKCVSQVRSEYAARN